MSTRVKMGAMWMEANAPTVRLARLKATTGESLHNVLNYSTNYYELNALYEYKIFIPFFSFQKPSLNNY